MRRKMFNLLLSGLLLIIVKGIDIKFVGAATQQGTITITETMLDVDGNLEDPHEVRLHRTSDDAIIYTYTVDHPGDYIAPVELTAADNETRTEGYYTTHFDATATPEAQYSDPSNTVIATVTGEDNVKPAPSACGEVVFD